MSIQDEIKNAAFRHHLSPDAGKNKQITEHIYFWVKP